MTGADPDDAAEKKSVEGAHGAEAPAEPARPTPEDVLAECDLEFFRAGGPGGQHRNRRETGVRLTHRPTGIVVTATERRSQVANRRLALLRLIDRLERLRRRRKPRKPTRKSGGVRARERQERERQSQKKADRRRRSDSE